MKDKQAVAILAHIACDLAHLRKLCAFGLRNIEDVSIAEADEHRTVLFGDVLFGFFLWLPAYADDGRQNADTALAFLHLAAKLVPRIQAGHARCVWLLPCDLQNVAEAVVVKTAHRVEVGGERFRVSCLQLLDEALDVGSNGFLGSLPFGFLAADGSGAGGCVLHGLCSFALAFALHAVGM